MPFWDETTGAVRLRGDMCLYPHMPRQELLRVRACLTDAPLAYELETNGAVLPFPAFAVPGGRLACVCVLHGEKLHAVEFWVANVGQRKRGNADQQRALLFQCLRAADPSKDSKRSVLLRCAFGGALVATDPHSGDATLRLTYR